MRIRQLLGLIVGLWLGGCAAPLPPAGQAESSGLQRLASQAPTTMLDAPTFFAQRDRHCGPAALAMVLADLGYPVVPDTVAPLTYLPGRKGTLQLEMLAAARTVETFPSPVLPRLDALLHEVAAGNTPIVLLNLGLRSAPRWHYATVVGYDLNEETVTVRSGTGRRETFSIFTFNHVWSRARRWAFTIHRPGELPAGTNAPALQQAAIAFARLNPGAPAQRVWEALARRMPQKSAVWIGYGNSAYFAGDLNAASHALEMAVRTDPASSIAWNNLAVVFTAQKRFDSAAKALRHAVSADPRIAQEIARTRDALTMAVRLRK